MQIRPDGGSDDVSPTAERVIVPMSCASEGAVDVYIEPYRQPTLLVVVGFSPVAEALVRVGQALDYEVVRVIAPQEQVDLERDSTQVVGLADLGAYLAGLPDERRRMLAAIVASQGHYDEPALEALLAVHPLYLGLVASRKRGSAAKGLLLDKGIAASEVDTIHNPAGVDLGGTTPGEVAISILAEVIALKAHPRAQAATPRIESERAGGMSEDPVCGMDVDTGATSHTADYDGSTYYFCCQHCKASFEKDPIRYLERAGIA